MGTSLNPHSQKEAYSFATKMKEEAAGVLSKLEIWTKRQNSGLELASDTGALEKKFDSLLVVMDALYQVIIAVLECSS